jgi:hypothetical protein
MMLHNFGTTTDWAVSAKRKHLLIPQHIQRHQAMETSVKLYGQRWVFSEVDGWMQEFL